MPGKDQRMKLNWPCCFQTETINAEVYRGDNDEGQSALRRLDDSKSMPSSHLLEDKNSSLCEQERRRGKAKLADATHKWNGHASPRGECRKFKTDRTRNQSNMYDKRGTTGSIPMGQSWIWVVFVIIRSDRIEIQQCMRRTWRRRFPDDYDFLLQAISALPLVPRRAAISKAESDLLVVADAENWQPHSLR